MFSLYEIKTLHKGNAIFNLKEKRLNLMKSYLMNIAQDIKYKVFYNTKTEQYIFTFKVPSESNPEFSKPFFYDVVFCFTPIDTRQEGVSNTLNEYKLTVFSNSPAFVFNYTYVFKQHGYLIPWVNSKYWSVTALKYRPTVRNKFEIILYEKSIYFCYLCIMQNNLYKKSILNDIKQDIRNNSDTLREVIGQNDKLVERRKWDKYFKENKKEKVKQKWDRTKRMFHNKDVQLTFKNLLEDA